jgi:hypothetical protein
LTTSASAPEPISTKSAAVASLIAHERGDFAPPTSPLDSVMGVSIIASPLAESVLRPRLVHTPKRREIYLQSAS